MNFIYALAIIWSFFTIVFLIAWRLNNYSIVDMVWGLGFVLVAWSMVLITYFETGEITLLAGFITLAITLWGLRLTWHIGRRNWNKPEDFRYQDMRQHWGTKHPVLKAYVNVFLVQGAFQYLIFLSSLYGITYHEPLFGEFPWVLGFGMIIFLIGFLFEAIGDAQLKHFIRQRENKGKLMTRGLWAWTRHPNYFGEATLWWGIALPVFFLPYGILFVISPLVISWLIRYVSGVPLLERKYAAREDFQVYMKSTSIFFPWPPKRS